MLGFLNEYAADIHENAVDKGWYDGEKTIQEAILLIHTELSEAVEELRNGHDPSEIYYAADGNGQKKPEGVPVEFADVIIRLLDTAAHFDMDISRAFLEKVTYNRTRPHMHGGKRF